MGTAFRVINWTDKQERKMRYETCLSCEKLISDKVRICSECGCFILGISKLKDKTCPLNKWQHNDKYV